MIEHHLKVSTHFSLPLTFLAESTTGFVNQLIIQIATMDCRYAEIIKIEIGGNFVSFQVLHFGYTYYLSKFLDFIDTFCFIARKKFDHIRQVYTLVRISKH